MTKTTNKTYVKEVQRVIDLGMPAEDVRRLFDTITDEFESMFAVVESADFHARIEQIRKEEIKFYREIIDRIAGEYGLTWREVKYEEIRVKRCEICQSWFYVTARNGKSLTCERFGTYRRFDLTNREYYYWKKGGRRLSECAVKYELARRHPTVRHVQEILFDPSPSSEDVEGNVFLNEIDDAYQRQINPYQNEWTYWKR